MTDLYGCGRHRTDEARELAVMKVEQPPRMQLPEWEGQMHVIREEDTVSICQGSLTTPSSECSRPPRTNTRVLGTPSLSGGRPQLSGCGPSRSGERRPRNSSRDPVLSSNRGC